MSPFATARRVRRATTWLLILLCTSFVAWRLNSRIEQYLPANTSSAPVAFFDANERNISSLAAACVPLRPVADVSDTFVSLPHSQPSSAQPVDKNQSAGHVVLPAILIYSATLFSNPPPSSLA